MSLSAAPGETNVAALWKQLGELQQPDGGWRQADGLASDAFATGQSLYALHRAGATVDNEAVQRAIEFLIRTQQADGTWSMVSQSDPTDGRPADYLNPITYAGTAWAVLGIASHVPAADKATEN